MPLRKLLLVLSLLAALISVPSLIGNVDGTRAKSVQVSSVPAPPQASVDAAIAAPLIRYNRNITGGAHTNTPGPGGAPVILAGAALAWNASADARLLEQIRYTLTGGNDISANGGYPAQHERHVTAMFALVKRTPRIWNQLSTQERLKIDLLMKAAFVASAFTTSDGNPYIRAGRQQHALDGDSNLAREWNPNYREGMVGMLLMAVVYYDGPVKAHAVLDTYDHATFVGELALHGLTNIQETFTWKARHPESNAPTATMIEHAIKGYRYKETSLQEYMKIYWLLTTDTYGKTVHCGLNEGNGVALPGGSRAGMLLSGCEGLPNKGVLGMLKELDSNDANGPRSSTLYSYDGFRVNPINHYVLIASRYWQRGRLADECLALMQIGVPDLWYKIERGYRNYARGRVQTDLTSTSTNRGYQFTKPLWEKVVRPYHGLL